MQEATTWKGQPAVAQEQYKSLQTGLQAVGQVKGWKVQQIVFVGVPCGSIHVESFNRNMKAVGVLESKWDPIRKKLVRRLLEEPDKVLRSYFAQKGGTRSKGRTGAIARAGSISNGTYTREDGARGSWPSAQRFSGEHGNWGCFVCLLFSLV